jgi:hypothetical protein
MLKSFIYSVIFIVSIWVGLAQNVSGTLKFPKSVLKNPNSNKEILEKSFKYREIYKFNRDTVIENSVILDNSYAKFKISNPLAWKKDEPNRKVKSIDIVFTNYPFKKEDWLTNYHDLLANRLKELFRIDSLLNNSAIEWNIVLQTSCKTDAETRKLFHGIVIHYSFLNAPILTEENEDEHIAKIKNFIRSEKKKMVELKNVERDDTKMRVYNRNDPQQKKERKKKSKTCPSFR